MNHEEFWILDLVPTFRVPLSALTCASDHIGQMFNRPSHGLPGDELEELLWRMFRAELLDVSKSSDHTIFKPSNEQVINALTSHEPKDDLFFGLTPLGGAQWESAANPDWNSYCRFEFEEWVDRRSGIGEATSASHATVERQMVMQGLSRLQIDLKSLRWDTLRPWPATYWKMLPFAERVRFGCRPIETPTDQHWCTEFQQWQRTRNCWYANPFTPIAKS